MPKIIVMNNLTEQMLGQNLSPAVRALSAKSSIRHVWFAEANDIIVSPVPIAHAFLRYAGDLLGFDGDSIAIVAPSLKENSAPDVLSDQMLLSDEILRPLQDLTAKGTGWSLMPCYSSAGCEALGKALGLEVNAFAAQLGPDLLNRKSHFRRLASGLRLPVAPGTIAYDAKTLARAVHDFLPATGTVILKKDNGAGGMGNIALTNEALYPRPGVSQTLPVRGDIEAMAQQLWERLTDDGAREIVIEAYFNASHMVYVEYFIDERGTPVFSHDGSIRLVPHPRDPMAPPLWVGLEIPFHMPVYSQARLLTESMRLASLAATLGYRGSINIDAILTDRSEIVFNEANARWGGGSILHEIGQRLFGINYADRVVLTSQRVLTKGRSFVESLNLLKELDLHFDAQKGEGILLVGYTDNSLVEALLISPRRERNQELEASVLKAFA